MNGDMVIRNFSEDKIPVEVYIEGITRGSGQLSVGLLCEEDGFKMPYATITKDMGVETNPAACFIDTNNVPEAESFLVKYDLAYPTGHRAESGFCLYPLYQFDIDKLSELSGTDVKAFLKLSEEEVSSCRELTEKYRNSSMTKFMKLVDSATESFENGSDFSFDDDLSV